MIMLSRTFVVRRTRYWHETRESSDQAKRMIPLTLCGQQEAPRYPITGKALDTETIALRHVNRPLQASSYRRTAASRTGAAAPRGIHNAQPSAVSVATPAAAASAYSPASNVPVASFA